MPTPLWSLAIIVLSGIGGVAFAFGVTGATRDMPEQLAQAVIVGGQVIVQLAIGVGAIYALHRRARRRARRLLRRLTTAEQYEGYLEHGYVVEEIARWRAEIHELGVRWVDLKYPDYSFWQCRYVKPGYRLCREDRVIAQLVITRHRSGWPPVVYERRRWYE